MLGTIEKLVYKREFFDFTKMCFGAKQIITITNDGAIVVKAYALRSRKAHLVTKAECSAQVFHALCERLVDCIETADSLDGYRQAMAWEECHPMEEVYRSLIALRKEHPALRYGSFRTNIASDKVYSYSRIWKDQKITVTMNLGAVPIHAPKQGRLLLKKGENRDIIGAWEYEVREEQIHGGDDL